MKSKSITSIGIKLILSEDEANWLREYVQNPKAEFPGWDGPSESNRDSKMRRLLWKALSKDIEREVLNA